MISIQGETVVRSWCLFDLEPSELLYEKYFSAYDASREPMRPPAAYFLFVADARAAMRLPAQEMAIALQTGWKNLGRKERAKYNKRASELQVEYEKRRDEWRVRLR